MVGLLLPIALHTQVEYPFYISAYHWVIFLFLLFVIFQPGCTSFSLNLSQSAGRLMKGLSGMLFIIVFSFCGTSLYYSYQITYIVYSGEAKVSDLSSISKHPYFSDVATRYMLASLSRTEQISKGSSITLNYAQWMEAYLINKPNVGIFIDLIRVYSYLEDSERMRAVIKRALYLFSDQPLLLNVVDEVLPTAKDR